MYTAEKIKLADEAKIKDLIEESANPFAKEKAEALYLHIPFCRRRCTYCDFYSFAADGERLNEKIEEYLSALEIEAELLEKTLQKFKLSPQELKTVYIGGGTPSLLNANQIARLFKILRKNFKIAPDAEITSEVNPESADIAYLKAAHESGVTRISSGLQSHDSLMLKRLGRLHTAEDFARLAENVATTGFEHFSGDLIFALPGQSYELWVESLDFITSFAIDHISFYALGVVNGTMMNYLYAKKGAKAFPSFSMNRKMYFKAIKYLAAKGFKLYEISSAAKPGAKCLHNLQYWQCKPYLALGPSAAAYFGGLRIKNPSSFAAYKKELNEGRLPAYVEEVIDYHEAAEEYMLLAFRLCETLRKKDFTAIFGQDIDQYFKNELQSALRTKVIEENDEGYKITGKGLYDPENLYELFI